MRKEAGESGTCNKDANLHIRCWGVLSCCRCTAYVQYVGRELAVLGSSGICTQQVPRAIADTTTCCYADSPLVCSF